MKRDFVKPTDGDNLSNDKNMGDSRQLFISYNDQLNFAYLIQCMVLQSIQLVMIVVGHSLKSIYNESPVGSNLFHTCISARL